MGKLFSTTVANAKPLERPYKLTDGAGLSARKAERAKALADEHAYLGKQRTLSFGPWPEVGLADAREQFAEARRLIAALRSVEATGRYESARRTRISRFRVRRSDRQDANAPSERKWGIHIHP